MKVSRNAKIVIANICSACVLLFCSSFFFFQNMRDLVKDFTKPSMFYMPLIFIASIIFVCFYIIQLVFNIESKTVHHADRFDLVYKIVFSITLMVIIIRSFLGDFLYQDSQVNPFTIIIVLGIASGITTWCIPKIRDNDNTEF